MAYFQGRTVSFREGMCLTCFNGVGLTHPREAGSKDLFGEWQTQPHEPTKGWLFTNSIFPLDIQPYLWRMVFFWGIFCKSKWVFPKIGGKPPKWMVYFMENPIKMDDLGGFPIFLETPKYLLKRCFSGWRGFSGVLKTKSPASPIFFTSWWRLVSHGEGW